jgi:hypothetical protein
MKAQIFPDRGARVYTYLVPLAERIEAYVDACPPAISGQGGHRQTFTVAVGLIRGFDLTIEQALPYLERYNARCEPPWTTKELLRKLKKVQAISTKKSGYLL